MSPSTARKFCRSEFFRHWSNSTQVQPTRGSNAGSSFKRREKLASISACTASSTMGISMQKLQEEGASVGPTSRLA
ncbi:hypothetical protein SMAC4_13710 [Sordaria macrospora]|uniref:uncharacterized protein n=1 Tax=Sordaria macrospora TaxID=5147 RepID=UPI002B296AF8|nr:hypothetical protein SMAC4_13710 [Sordaria macrospora]